MVLGVLEPARPRDCRGDVTRAVASICRRSEDKEDAHKYHGSSLTHDSPCPGGLEVLNDLINPEIGTAAHVRLPRSRWPFVIAGVRGSCLAAHAFVLRP